MHPFEKVMSVTVEDIEFDLAGFDSISWLDFWLNPRKLRGSDFLMRWSQGVWSEKRLTEAINSSHQFFAIPYGPSGVAPTDDVRKFELYFERLEEAGLGKIKRPDLLIFKIEDKPYIDEVISKLGGLEELPFIPEKQLGDLLSHAVVAIECENSLWVTEKMPGYGRELTPQRRLNKQPGLSKATVVPTVIIKEEDRGPLLKWQENTGVPIHVWHVFFDRAFGLSFDKAEKLIKKGLTEETKQKFQSSNGSTQIKVIYKHYYHHAYLLGEAIETPELTPAFIQDKNGHILPYVKFEGGKLKLNKEVFEKLNEIANK